MWIESHQSIRNHPKVKKAARLADISEPEMIGRLHYLWWWALDYAPDGDVTKYNSDDIEDAVDWHGKSGIFYKSLIDCGFNDHKGLLETFEDGSIHIHDWMEYGGKLLEQRELNSDRARRKRELYDDMRLTRAVKTRDKNICRYCGIVVDWADRKGNRGGTYDHINPDGDNSEDNLVVSCRSCNSKKNRRTPEQAGMSLIPIDNLPEIYPESSKNLLLQNRTEQTEQYSTEPTEPPAKPDGLNDLQHMVLAYFGAKRFKNTTQAALVAAWDRYPQNNVIAACEWAATKGFGLGQAIASIEAALPKWNAPKKSGNGMKKPEIPSISREAIEKQKQELNRQASIPGTAAYRLAHRNDADISQGEHNGIG